MPVGESGPWEMPVDHSSRGSGSRGKRGEKDVPDDIGNRISRPAPPDERHGILVAARETDGLDRLINEFRRTRGVTPEHTDTLLGLVARYDGFNISDDLKEDYLAFVKGMPKIVPAKPADMVKFLELGARLLSKERYGCRSTKILMDVFPKLSDYSSDTFQVFDKIVGQFVFPRQWKAKKEDSLQYAKLHSVQGDLDQISYELWGPFQDGWLSHKKQAAEIASKVGDKMTAGAYFVEAANAARQMYLDETLDQGSNGTVREMANNWIDMYMASARATSDHSPYHLVQHTIFAYFAAADAANTILKRELQRDLGPRVNIPETQEARRRAYGQCIEWAGHLMRANPTYHTVRVHTVVDIAKKQLQKNI